MFAMQVVMLRMFARQIVLPKMFTRQVEVVILKCFQGKLLFITQSIKYTNCKLARILHRKVNEFVPTEHG